MVRGSYCRCLTGSHLQLAQCCDSRHAFAAVEVAVGHCEYLEKKVKLGWGAAGYHYSMDFSDIQHAETLECQMLPTFSSFFSVTPQHCRMRMLGWYLAWHLDILDFFASVFHEAFFRQVKPESLWSQKTSSHDERGRNALREEA